MEKKKFSFILSIICAILAMLPFVITFTSEDGVIYTPMIADSPQHLEMEKGLILFAAVVVLIYRASRFIALKKNKKRTALGLSIFFALCVVFGKSYEAIASWGYIFSSFSAFITSIAIIAGYTVMFYCGVGALFTFIERYDDIVKNNVIMSALSKNITSFLGEKSIIKIWIILMICWLPYLIIDYPAVIHADSGVMLSEFFNKSLYNHHPVLQTIIWGSFVEFGHNFFNSYNIGVFLFVLLQFVYGSFIVSLLLDYVYKKKYPVIIIFIAFLIIALMPAFPRNATAVCKDSNHTFYFMFMIWLIIKTVDLKERIWTDAKNRYLILLWVLTILFVAFSKKSGVYVVILTAPFLLFYLRKYTKALISVLIAFILGLGIYYGGEYAIENVWDIGNDDTKEIYSIPFQQTARFVRDFGDDVTAEERQVIDKILDYNALPELYNPELCDPVKNSFKQDSTDEDFSEYLVVWFSQIFKHPTVYIQATLNNIYGYFYPENIGYYKDLFFMTQCVDEDKIFAPEGLKEASEKLCDINMKSRKLPVIGLFSSLGFFVWSDILVMLYFMLYKKDKKFVIYNIPVIITLLTCIASPVNNTMRYGLPIMFMVPILFCMCFKNKEE